MFKNKKVLPVPLPPEKPLKVPPCVEESMQELDLKHGFVGETREDIVKAMTNLIKVYQNEIINESIDQIMEAVKNVLKKK